MKKQKKGISLIVLIITIIVIIILATAILVSVVSNNPTGEANKAKYENDRDNMQSIVTSIVGKIMAKELGNIKVSAGQLNSITKDVKETTGEIEYTIYNSITSKNINGKIIFDKGANDTTKYYTGKKLPIYAAGETKWYVDSEGVLSLEVAGVKYGNSEIITSSTVASDPLTYYGKKVTNYETGDATIDSQVEWQIFHSDGNNIYLIATDYIAGSLAPAGKLGGNLLISDYSVSFYYVMSNYQGSTEITESSLQSLNKKFYEYLTLNNTTSSYGNMLSVAYLMDTSDAVWGKFAGKDAAYAIGGPTLELFLDSYNAKKGTNYQCKVESTTGYKVSTDGTSWSTWFNGIEITDTQYVLPSKNNGGKINGMWLASPSANHVNHLQLLRYDGVLGTQELTNNNFGLRPIVCLNYNIVLEKVDGGFAIID